MPKVMFSQGVAKVCFKHVWDQLVHLGLACASGISSVRFFAVCQNWLIEVLRPSQPIRVMSSQWNLWPPDCQSDVHPIAPLRQASAERKLDHPPSSAIYKIPIEDVRLYRCMGWSESSLGEHVQTYIFLTLVLLKPDIPFLYKQCRSRCWLLDWFWRKLEANSSGSALLAMKYVNLYQQSGSSNLTGWKLEVGMAS